MTDNIEARIAAALAKDAPNADQLSNYMVHDGYPDPAPRVWTCATCGGVGSTPTHRSDCPLFGAGYIGRHEGAPSIFDQPDAGFVYAIERGRQLAATLDDVVLSGDATRQAEWMGSAAAILGELTK